jgi:hypothetical protein
MQLVVKAASALRDAENRTAAGLLALAGVSTVSTEALMGMSGTVRGRAISLYLSLSLSQFKTATICWKIVPFLHHTHTRNKPIREGGYSKKVTYEVVFAPPFSHHSPPLIVFYSHASVAPQMRSAWPHETRCANFTANGHSLKHVIHFCVIFIADFLEKRRANLVLITHLGYLPL